MREFAIVLTGVMAAGLAANAQESLNFREEFVGENLPPEFRVLNPDPNRMAFVDGEYLLLLTHPEPKNVMSYANATPNDFVVTVRFAATPEYDYQGTNISFGEGGNRLSFGFYVPYGTNCCGTRSFFYGNKYLNDEVSRLRVEVPWESGGFYLRVTKNSVEYTGEYSFNGVDWNKIGTHVSVNPYRSLSFSAFNEGEAPESPIRVDSFEIVDLSGR